MQNNNNKEEISKALEAIWQDGDVREVRTFPDRSLSYPLKYSGYFDSVESLSAAVAKLSPEQFEALYVTLHPCNVALLARANNRLLRSPKATTADSDAINCNLLLIDVDPVRPAGVSATEEEKAHAQEVVSKIMEKYGKPCLHQDSGNGYHAIYRVDTDDVEAKKHFLAMLDRDFSTPEAKVDLKVFNPSRIVKIAGTWSRKGDATTDRPHRMAKVLDVNAKQSPLVLPPVLVAEVKPAKGRPKKRSDFRDGNNADLVRNFLQTESISFREKEQSGATFFCLNSCFFDSNHTQNDSAVVVNGSGMITYQCFHNSCSGRRWADVKDMHPLFFSKNGTKKAGRQRKEGSESDGSGGGSSYPTQSDWDALFAEMNWTFNVDELTHDVLLNRKPMADSDWALIRRKTRDWLVMQGLKRDIRDLEDAVTCKASENPINEIKEYLGALKWDGIDRISELAAYFKVDVQSHFARILEYWFAHSVARIYTPIRSLCLVLQGAQEKGKSFFAKWLCPLNVEKYFNESDIRPEDKDCKIRSAYVWIWELAELDKTTRKADTSALKNFISATSFKERKPFGHTDANYKPISIFLGTVNPEIFLVDQTGNSRFIVVKTEDICWDYTKLDKNQIWAQAVVAWREGKHVLTDDDRALRNNQNDQATSAYTFESYLDEALEPQVGNVERLTTIMQFLTNQHITLTRNNELWAYLKKRGFDRTRIRGEEKRVIGVKDAYLNLTKFSGLLRTEEPASWQNQY